MITLSPYSSLFDEIQLFDKHRKNCANFPAPSNFHTSISISRHLRAIADALTVLPRGKIQLIPRVIPFSKQTFDQHGIAIYKYNSNVHPNLKFHYMRLFHLGTEDVATVPYAPCTSKINDQSYLRFSIDR